MKRDEQPAVVVLGGEESRRLVADAVGDQDLRLEWLREPAALGTSAVEPAAVLVERELVDGPGEVDGWVRGGRLRPAVPLLLIVGQRPEAPEFQDWLRAGVWDMVSVPIDTRMLGLRIRNLVGHQRRPLPGRTWLHPNWPYAWTGLVRATEETLDLSRRHDRPIACTAIAVQGDTADPPEVAARLLNRLGAATQEWVRGSDLVGLSDSGVILVVLPDTTLEETRLFMPRLVATLERRLQRWSVVARLDAYCSAPAPGQSASEFLLQAVRNAC